MIKTKKIFKKLCCVAMACATSLLLSSCAGSYDRYQEESDKYKPCNCDGYHMNHAEWHYVDRFGQKVDVIGKCTRGMKNGNFDFYVNGIQVARTKFSRDEEIKTKCFINGVQTYNLYTCMSINANGMNPNVQGNNQAPAVQAPVKKSVWD